MHYNGTAWSSFTCPQPTASITAVYALTPALAWAVGTTGSYGYVFAWDGTRWSQAFTAAYQSALSGVWATAADNVFAVGYSYGGSYGGLAYRYNGTTWLSVGSANNATLLAVHGSDANNIWTVGTNGTILRWTGTQFTSAISPNSNINFQGIYATGANQAWAVGTNGSVGTLYRWGGVTWDPVPATNIPLFGISGLGPNKAWTVGQGGAILRYTP
ncbi:MAG: hypothetical protein U1A78_39745 [Polyangia bacterium]